VTPAQQFARLYSLAPAEAVRYLQRRQQLTPTFDWRALWQEEHAHQFTVSRLARLDLLQSIHDGITASVQGDLSRRDWTRDIKGVLAQAGWWGTVDVRDPQTGEQVQTRFDPRRLKLIYNVNTRMAYASGLWERVQRNKRTHPYLRYITKDDSRVRDEHRQWHNLVLPVDDPFWATHYPPNGWGCRCRVVAVSQREYERGKTPRGEEMVKNRPMLPTREWINRRTGEVMQVPAGIDPGFGYNVGVANQRGRDVRQLIDQKLKAADAQLATAAQRAGLSP
jgi:SPP1 gp7 family putative phage head morphogenesis protein